MSGSGHAIINFEIMFDHVREFEADYVDANDYVLNYKNNISYMNTSKAEVQILESYLILTKKYLYVFDLSNEDYPLINNPPVKIDEIASLQLSMNNTLAAAFKIKPNLRTDVDHIIIEDDTMEDFVTFLKATFGTKIPVEYKDQLYFKNTEGKDLAFNLIDMRFFDPKDLKARFGKPQFYGFLDKISCNWRSKVSSIFGGGVKWLRKMYVLKNGSIFVYEENNYDKPSKVFSLALYALEKPRPKEYNKAFVFRLMAPDEEQRVFSAPDENDFKNWLDLIQEAIDEHKEKAARF